MNNTKLSGLCALVLMSAGPAVAQGAFVYTNLPMVANSVDASDRAVGYHYSAQSGTSGAVWANGTMILVPAVSNFSAVSSNGLAAGQGDLPKQAKDAYPKRAKPSFVTYDISSAVTNTYAMPARTDIYYFIGGINNAGVAATDLQRPDSNAYTTTGDVFTQVKYPKAKYTSIYGINDSGQVSGSFADSAGLNHSFTLQGKVHTAFDPPGAVASSATATTDSGITYGQFTDSAGINNGYVLNNGIFTTIQYPGAPTTVVTGIGPSNEVVGFYLEADNTGYGFVVVNGTYYQVGPKGYVILGTNQNGTIVGYINYENNDVGFIATCAANQFPCTK